MFAVVFYLACLTIAPQLWIEPFIGWPTDYISLILMFAALFISGRIRNFLTLSSFDILLAAFAMWVTICAIKHGMTPAGEEKVIWYWKILLIVKTVEALVDNLDRLRQVTNWLILIAVILAIQAIQQKLDDVGLGWANQGRGWVDPIAAAAGEKGRSRWIGIFGGLGTSAVLFTSTYPLTLAYLNSHYGITKKTLAASAAFLLLWAIYCTGSRGGLLAAMSVSSLYLMIRLRVSALAIALITTIVVIFYAVAPSHLTTVRDSSNSTQYRVEMWAAGLNMVKSNPVFGVGPGDFIRWTGKLIAHNSAIEVHGELGFIGIIIWVAMIYLSLKSAIQFREVVPDEWKKWFAVGLALSLIGHVVSSMFVTLEYETFYLLMTFCAVLNRCSANPAKLTTKDRYAIVGIICIWLVVLQYFVIAYFD